MPTVAVVGRPHVGKSTLVNRVLGRRAAITEELPGVTRDRVGYEAEWAGHAFQLIDTGGYEPRARGLTARVVAQAERAMAEAGVILLVVDATVGVTDLDEAVARRVRGGPTPVLLVANKVDSVAQEADLGALWSLGLGAPWPVSGLHGRGSGDLLDAVVDLLPPDAPEESAGEGPPDLAIVGRPNVGKSSLLNRLAGDEVAIVDPVPGTTRDTIDSVVEHGGQAFRFIDTAGMRRQFQRAKGADYYAFVRSLEAVDRADVALLVLDAAEGVAEQDQKVALRALEAGCGLILLANKWDLVDGELRAELDRDLEHRLHFLDWAPLLRVSARTGRGVQRIWPTIERVLESRSARVPTAALNAWLGEVTLHTPAPPAAGKAVKLRYATQTGVRPPQVVFFATGRVAASYRRHLEHELRRAFGFEGTPLRIISRVRAGAPRPRD